MDKSKHNRTLKSAESNIDEERMSSHNPEHNLDSHKRFRKNHSEELIAATQLHDEVPTSSCVVRRRRRNRSYYRLYNHRIHRRLCREPNAHSNESSSLDNQSNKLLAAAHSDYEVASCSNVLRCSCRQNYRDNYKYSYSHRRRCGVHYKKTFRNSLGINNSNKVFAATQPHNGVVSCKKQRVYYVRYYNHHSHRRFRCNSNEYGSRSSSLKNVSNKLLAASQSHNEVSFSSNVIRRTCRRNRRCKPKYKRHGKHKHSDEVLVARQDTDEVASCSNTVSQYTYHSQSSMLHQSQNTHIDENVTPRPLDVDTDSASLGSESGAAEDNDVALTPAEQVIYNHLVDILADNDGNINIYLSTDELYEALMDLHTNGHIQWTRVMRFHMRNLNITNSDVIRQLAENLVANPNEPVTAFEAVFNINPLTDEVEEDFSAAGDFNYPED